MRKLTYTVTTKKGGVTSGITSFAIAKEMVQMFGGEMVAVMQDIETPYNYTGKRVRPKAKAAANMD